MAIISRIILGSAASAALIFYMIGSSRLSELEPICLMVAVIWPLIVNDVFPHPEKNNSFPFLELSQTPSYSLNIIEIFNISDGVGYVDLVIHKPTILDNTDYTEPMPVLIWYHGGGFSLPNAKADEAIYNTISDKSGFLVVIVEYRLAPKHKYPAAHHDSMLGLRWIYKNIAKYNGDPNRIVIGGESAGGNLATGVIAKNIENSLQSSSEDTVVPLSVIKGLLPIYPCLQHGVYHNSHILYRDIGLLPLKQMIWFWKLYLNDQYHDVRQYTACPLITPDHLLQHFPPTILFQAKYDILLDEGIEFAKRLQFNNISNEVLIYNHSMHGFFGRFGKPGSQVLTDLTDRLRSLVMKENNNT
eukprot:gene8045-16494_t